MQFIQTVQTHSSDIKIASFDAIITFICVMIGIACGQYGDVRRVNQGGVNYSGFTLRLFKEQAEAVS